MDNLQDLITFGHNLDIITKQRNLSNQQLARQINYSRIDLAAILSGQKNITLKTITKIARVLDYAPYILFSRHFITLQHYSYNDIDYMELIRKKMEKIAPANVDLHSATLTHILHGRRNNPTFKTLKKLADAANVSMSDLLKPDTDLI